LAPAALRPTPLFRLGAARRSTFSHKGRRQELRHALVASGMNQLQNLGVQISIDDFGTGYSSLSALKTFPVARLKIDKSFINDIAADENDQAVASAVISLGQNLNLRVIAEGVETDDQVAFLRKNNCDEMQGLSFQRTGFGPRHRENAQWRTMG
jgi:EAL domain-containing protein (putative c-di-GMP-specific phosphodiesterase class I)